MKAEKVKELAKPKDMIIWKASGISMGFGSYGTAHVAEFDHVAKDGHVVVYPFYDRHNPSSARKIATRDITEIKRWDGSQWNIITIAPEEAKKVICPGCGEEVWDVSTVDQRLNKCWKCGLRFDNEESNP